MLPLVLLLLQAVAADACDRGRDGGGAHAEGRAPLNDGRLGEGGLQIQNIFKASSPSFVSYTEQKSIKITEE